MKHTSLWRCFTLGIINLLCCYQANPLTAANVLYVAPSGVKGAPGTAAAPLALVQEALDRARPGDTVHLRPGVYRERVSFKGSGTYGKPITLEGVPGAIVDGSEPGQLNWQPAPDVAPGAYRTRVTFPAFTVVANGKIVTMLREDRVAVGKPKTTVYAAQWEWPQLFKNGVGPSGWEGVKALALYFQDKQELLIRFQGDLDPRTIPITVAPREPVVHIAGSNRCVVRGLTLRNAAYGVRIEDSIGSVVENCTIGPVDYGVWLDAGADRCTVRFNEMFMNPYAGADPKSKGAWDNWQAHKTGGHYDRYGVQIHKTPGGHEVHDNFIHDVWDGIEDRGGPGENRGLHIHHNRIFNISDDGLEPNGAEEDCRWHDNIVERSICGFRIKAPTTGPLYAYRNIFFDNSEDFRNYGEVQLKPAFVYVYHNTCTAPAAIVSNKIFGIGTPNYHYFNNLFWCAYWWRNDGNSIQPNWKGDYNVYVRRDQHVRWDATRPIAAQLGLDTHSLWTEGNPGFTNFAGRDVSLQPNSPARGRSADLTRLLGKTLPGCEPGYYKGAAPDAGAVQFGNAMPRLPRRAEEVKHPPAGMWPGPEAETQAAVAPIFENGGFEQGLKHWGQADATIFQVKTDTANEGKQYLAITVGEKRAELQRRITGLVPGRPYTLTFQSRRSTFQDTRIIIRNLNTQQYAANAPPSSTPQWQSTRLRFVAPATKVGLEISLRSAGTCDLDSFTLTPGR